jgi:hypothetical protein
MFRIHTNGSRNEENIWFYAFLPLLIQHECLVKMWIRMGVEWACTFGIQLHYHISLYNKCQHHGRQFQKNSPDCPAVSFTCSHTVLKGQLCFMTVEIISIFSDTSPFLWVQTSRRMTCGTFIKKKLFKDKAAIQVCYLGVNFSSLIFRIHHRDWIP